MGTTNDRGLTFEYHAEQRRRSSLAPERGRSVTAGFVYGPNETPIEGEPLPLGVSNTQGCVFAFTASISTESPDYQMFSLGRVIFGLSRGFSIGFDTDGTFGASLRDFDANTLTGVAVQFLKYVKLNQVARFAIGIRPFDPSVAIAVWINGKLVATAPRGDFSFEENPWIGYESWYGLRDNGHVKLLYRQQPDKTDVAGRPQIDYYLGSPSLVGKRRMRNL